MFSRPLLVVLLFVLSPLAVRSQAQVESATRPRRTQTASVDANQPQLHQDEAEAKRLYKSAVKYQRAGLYQQAAETFEQAVKVKPDYGEAYLALGHAYYELHRWQPAVENIQRGLALKPHDNDSRKRLAQAQKMLQPERPAEADESVDGAKTIGSAVSLPAGEPTRATSELRNDEPSPTKIYRVGAGDVLDVRLPGDVSGQSTLFTVTAAGFIEHPSLSAPVQCAGLTVEEIASRLQDNLNTQAMMKDAKVSVAVQEYISHTIMVSGLVKEPGTKSLKREGIPLYVVVADAQPLPAAGRVSVRRSAWTQDSVFDVLDTMALNMLVRPGDVITLSERQAQFFYMSGQVKLPGEKPFHRGITLTQAIMSAGGLNKDAKEAQVSRDNGKGFLVVTRYKLKDVGAGKVPDPAIQPGDRINIID